MKKLWRFISKLFWLLYDFVFGIAFPSLPCLLGHTPIMFRRARAMAGDMTWSKAKKLGISIVMVCLVLVALAIMECIYRVCQILSWLIYGPESNGPPAGTKSVA